MTLHKAVVPREPGAARSARRRLLPAVLSLCLAAGALASAPTAVQASPPQTTQSLGANVTVFDPSMPLSEIQAKLNAVSDVQTDAEMGTARYAFLFKPGTYGTASTPLQVKVGYNTEIAGLGASPTDVTITGKVEVYNRCIREGGTYCVALKPEHHGVGALDLDALADVVDARGEQQVLAPGQLVVDRADAVARLGNEEAGQRDRAARRHAVGPAHSAGGLGRCRDAHLVGTLGVQIEERLLTAQRGAGQGRVGRIRERGVRGCALDAGEDLVPHSVRPIGDRAVAHVPLLL